MTTENYQSNIIDTTISKLSKELKAYVKHRGDQMKEMHLSLLGAYDLEQIKTFASGEKRLFEGCSEGAENTLLLNIVSSYLAQKIHIDNQEVVEQFLEKVGVSKLERAINSHFKLP
jgi:hypothetical protein